jgi:hypothetical protein
MEGEADLTCILFTPEHDDCAIFDLVSIPRKAILLSDDPREFIDYLIRRYKERGKWGNLRHEDEYSLDIRVAIDTMVGKVISKRKEVGLLDWLAAATAERGDNDFYACARLGHASWKMVRNTYRYAWWCAQCSEAARPAR